MKTKAISIGKYSCSLMKYIDVDEILGFFTLKLVSVVSDSLYELFLCFTLFCL